VSTLLRVLMLIDTVADADMLAHELLRTGFELAVRHATSEAAYLAALESPLDLILVDTALPAFDALRALQILRASERDIPLIVVTESDGEAAAIECVRLGAADFLFKNQPGRLRSAVIRALDQRDLRAHARAADAALRESEDRFRSAYDYAAIGMAIVGLDGCWLQANRALCTFTGYTEQELLATTFQAITHPDDLAIDLSNVRALVVGEVLSYQMEKRYFHKDGATIWALLSVSLVRDAQHQPRYFISQIQDITERKQTEASRALLAAIVDSSDDAIIGVAPDGTVLSWNSGAEHVYGYRADQMLGQPIATLRPSDMQDEAAQLYELLGRGEITAHIETVRRRNDGQLIDVALTISVIVDSSGAVSGFSTIARDISARKRDDHLLRQTTAFIKLFQEVAVAANQATSLDQALQTAVAAICTHIGWPVGHVYLPDPDMSGSLVPTCIWHLDDAQRFATFRTITEAVRLAPGIGLPGQVMASRKPAWISDIILTVNTPRTRVIQDLDIRAGFALPVLLGDDVAAVLEFFATVTIAPDAALLDILQHVGTQLSRVVERMRAEAARRESEERFRVLFAHSPDAIMLLDPHHPDVSWPIVECNEAACQINGYMRDELIGQSIDLLNTTAGSRAERAAYTARLRREGTIRFDAVHRRKDGSLFPIEVVSSLITVAGRELVLGIDRDISERKQMERMKNEFVATVSHELRTPLTSIRGALGLIAGGVAGAIPLNVQRMVDIACTNSDRLVRLINDILDIEKIESGKLVFTLQPIALLPLVVQAIEANRAYGAQFNVGFTLEDTVRNSWVNVDSDRLIQALTNLLANAVKFSPPGGIVRVRVSQDADMIQVMISDQGPGIPESFRDQLFQKFAQADSSTTREKGGTGLGLSITKAIIERLDGQLACAPDQHDGATFVVDLPAWHRPTPDCQ
jgi:PAS domain S-box-containing protein